MFGYTHFDIDAPKSTKPKSPTTASAWVSPMRYAQPSPSKHQLRPIQKQTQTRVSFRDKETSERFKNSTFSRLPSPSGVAIRTGSVSKAIIPPLAPSKGKYNLTTPKVKPLRERRSETFKQPVQTQCTKRARPHTAMNKQNTDKSVRESPSYESKVLITVKDVLDHLIKQKSSIGASDLDKVMNFISARLHGKEPANDFIKVTKTKRIDIEPKYSMTSVNVKSSSFNLFSGKMKSPAVTMPKEGLEAKINKSFDCPPENSLKNCFSNKTVAINESRENKYKDPNTEIVRDGLQNTGKGTEIQESLLEPVSKEPINSFVTGNSQNEGKVGDCQTNTCKPHDNIWKIMNEVDLRSYVASLVKTLNDDQSTKPLHSTVETSPKTISKDPNVNADSNVFNSDNISSKKYLYRPSRDNIMKASCKSSLTGVMASRNRLKLAESGCKVWNRNYQPQPETKKVDFSSQPATTRYNTQRGIKDANDKLISPIPTDESGEDFYLQRRRKQVGVKKDGLKVLHFGK